jgi:hypothetical protein
MEVQEVAFDEDQVSVEDCPMLRALGDAESEAVGAELVHEFEF